MNAQNFIESALRRCGQMRPGYHASPELLADGLQEWTMMFDGFNARRTMNYTEPDFIYPVTGPGTASLATGQILGMGYTIGQPFSFTGTTAIGSPVVLALNTQGVEINQAISGAGIPANTRVLSIVPGVSVTLNKNATAAATVPLTLTPDFSGVRPVAIARMNLWMTTASPTSPTRIPLSPLSAEEWANIAVLQLTPISVTNVFYYEARFPFGVIWVWPPLNANSLEFFTWGQLTPPASLTQAYSAPPGYADVVVYELAKRMWPMVTKDMAVHKVTLQWLCGQAKIARDAVRAVNAPSPRLANDFQPGRPSVGVSDWTLLLEGVPY